MTDSPPGHPEIERIVAPNPGPMTLEGTNTYLVGGPGEEGVYLIDPGPLADEHVAAVRRAASGRGGIAGILLTHSHADHSEAAGSFDAPLLWGRIGELDESSPDPGAGAEGDLAPEESRSERVGPFLIVPTPGHAVDHVCLVRGGVVFCGDLILGRGSSFVPPDGGSLGAYMESLRVLAELEPELLCPGHGPYVTEPHDRILDYREHRLDRERRLVSALAAGERSRSRLLDLVWDDVPAELRPAAGVVMQAHLEKLEAEGRADTARLVD